jgi:hypothetical protein
LSLHFLAIIFGLSSGLCPTYHSDTPRSEPHPLALFSLIPLNNRAADVIAHPCNSHLVSRLPAGILGLDIGLHMRSKSGNTIATLGRGDTDIFVGGSSIAKTQCSFEIDLDNNVVMLYDRSHGCTTQVFGEDAMPFEHGRIRKIVVQKNLNTTIGMGGQRQNLIQFRLLWYQGSTETEEKIKNRQGNPDAQEENPRLARTIDDLPTILPSQRETRVHPAGHQQLMLRYVLMGDALGSGQFGTVHKCRDVDSGKLMAVKVLEPSPGTSRPEDWNRSVYCALKREVETLSEISDVSMSSKLSLYEINTHTSQTLLIILRHNAGTNHELRSLWV